MRCYKTTGHESPALTVAEAPDPTPKSGEVIVDLPWAPITSSTTGRHRSGRPR